jgi:hypothetical protein
MSERGWTSKTSGTGGKSEMSEKGVMREKSGTPLLAQTVLHAILRTLPVALVTRLSPVARRMCASEAHA